MEDRDVFATESNFSNSTFFTVNFSESDHEIVNDRIKEDEFELISGNANQYFVWQII
jgi:hypothetical protein